MLKQRIITASDASNVRAMTHSPGWTIVKERLQKTLDQKRDELELPSDAAKTAELRGTIAGLRLALNIPDILFVEGKGRVETE